MKKRFLSIVAAGMLGLGGLAYGINSSQPASCPWEGTPECPKMSCPLKGTPDCPFEKPLAVEVPSCCKKK